MHALDGRQLTVRQTKTGTAHTYIETQVQLSIRALRCAPELLALNFRPDTKSVVYSVHSTRETPTGTTALARVAADNNMNSA